MQCQHKLNNPFLLYKPKQHRARPVLVQHVSYWHFNGQWWPYALLASKDYVGPTLALHLVLHGNFPASLSLRRFNSSPFQTVYTMLQKPWQIKHAYCYLQHILHQQRVYNIPTQALFNTLASNVSQARNGNGLHGGWSISGHLQCMRGGMGFFFFCIEVCIT